MATRISDGVELGARPHIAPLFQGSLDQTGEMDLDDLLDEVDIPDDEDLPAPSSKQPQAEDVDLDAELSRQMEEQVMHNIDV